MADEPIENTVKTVEIQTEKPWLFKPGESGNPKGKPKGTKHFNTIFNEILKEMVEIKTKDGIVKMPLGKAMAQAMARKAVAGNVQAFEAVADRMDGKAVQAMEIEVTTPPVPIYGGKSTDNPKV